MKIAGGVGLRGVENFGHLSSVCSCVCVCVCVCVSVCVCVGRGGASGLRGHLNHVDALSSFCKKAWLNCFSKLLRLNTGAQGEYLTSQLLWVVAY